MEFKEAYEKCKKHYENAKQHPTFWILFGILLAVILLIWLPPLRVSHFEINNATVEATLENQYRATLAQILGGVAIGISLYYTHKRVSATEKSIIIAQEGQITERFTRAIDQLGAIDKLGNPAMEIRLGGIYALKRIADESEKDYWPIMEILTAYIRKNSAKDENGNLKVEKGKSQNEAYLDIKKEVSLDIQAILNVIGKHDHSFNSDKSNSLDLQRTYLEKANFEGANLQGFNLSWTNLTEANFEGADLKKANLKLANLLVVNLQGVDLTEANLTGANLLGANLEEANLTGANFHDNPLRYGSNLEYAFLTKANLQGANLEKANLKNAFLNGANLTGANLTGTNLIRANLLNANLIGAKLVNANLEEAIFVDANLEEANLVNANLQGANFLIANLTSASLEGANLKKVNLKVANLKEANFEGADLSEAHLEGANLIGTHLEEANLIGTHFEGAYLIGTHLGGADLFGADLEGAYLEGANLKEAKNLTIDQLSKAKTLFEATLDKELEISLREKYPDLFEKPNYNES